MHYFWAATRWVQNSNFRLSFKIQFQPIFWGLWTLVSSSDKFRAVLGTLGGLWLSKSFWAWKARLCTSTLKKLKIQKWKSDLFGYPKRRFDTFFDPKGSNFEFWPRLHRQIDEKKILQKKNFPCQIVKKTSMKIFLDTYLKSQKWHFWGAWKTIILTRSWAQSSPTGLKNCAEHDFTTENLISPLFGAVRDLENRQK